MLPTSAGDWNNIKVAGHPIEIDMPNGAIEHSTHTCYLRIPGWPKELREAHIVPGLSHSSLVPIKKYAEEDASLFSKIKFVKYGTYNVVLVLIGKDTGPGGLWILPIDGRASLDEEKPRGKTQKPPSIAAATVHTVPYKQQKIKYTHQTFFAMPPATFRKQ